MPTRRQKSKRTSNNRKGQGLSLQQLRAATDVGPSLSDGSSVVLSDMRQTRLTPAVPDNIPMDINDRIVWDRITLDLQGNLSAVAETQLGSYFTLAQNPNSASWATLFDQYCIPIVVCNVRFSENVNTIAGGAAPRCYTVLDHDDANTITVAQAKAYSTCKEQRTVDNVTRIIYPRIATAAYSGVFTSFANSRSWIDCASTTVQHYGMKTAIEADTRSPVGEYLLRFTIYYAFRNHH